MNQLEKFFFRGSLLSGVLTIVLMLLLSHPAAAAQFYNQTNLITDDQANLVNDGFAPATFTDSQLVNPWGISFNPNGPFWVSDNGTGVTTLHSGAGQPFPLNSPLIVTIPSPVSSQGTTSSPTGQVFNITNGFNVDSTHKSAFIFATENGTISSWNPVNPTNAILKVDNSVSGAVYKGLALGSNNSGDFLYAANFRAGTIDVFDSNFASTDLGKGSFFDPNLPSGFAPFNIQNLDGKLYVTYAKQDGAKHDDIAGAGNGFIDVFEPNGKLLTRLTSQGTLDSPWSLAFAPINFGKFSNDLLVGNFGDGRINAFDPNTGDFEGQLDDISGRPITTPI